jgi:hypothetical protein
MNLSVQQRFATRIDRISSFLASLHKPRFPQRRHFEVRHHSGGRRVIRWGNHGFLSQLIRSIANDGHRVAVQAAILNPVFCSIEPETPHGRRDRAASGPGGVSEDYFAAGVDAGDVPGL